MKAMQFLTAVAAASLALGISACDNGKAGISDTEIKIGNTDPYSGPDSSYSTIGKSIGAC